MKNTVLCRSIAKIYILATLLMFFTACFSSGSSQSKNFNLTNEEYLWLEKFFRYFMLHETAIYTLAGSKPLTEIHLFYEEKATEEFREDNQEEYLYFLLNRDNKKDMEFYKKLSHIEKKEKAFLIYEKDFIYDIENLWDRWEKIQHRFPIKKRFLLLKKERSQDSWENMFPNCKAIYDVLFVDVLKTAMVIQENYELFRQAVGYDFDSMEVVFELENKSSKFWDKITKKDAWRYSYLWGLLYGFGKENAFSHFWKSRHIRSSNCSQKEKILAQKIEKWVSCKNRPDFNDKNAFTLSNFTIPIFNSFSKDDPVVAKYESERERIKRLYKGKDFVTYTLELLTEYK
jgi:hypothetical protein